MYRIIKYLLVLMAIQIVGYAYGVSRDYYQDNMTSAQTADMIRYGDVEASLYTGLLNLSIPIYSLDDPDFSLDISLHYNSEGFKPCENSGFVGYKWSLRAGGCITREVRNIPDETIYRNQSANIYEEGMLHFLSNNSIDKNDIFALNPNILKKCINSHYPQDTLYLLGQDCDTDVDCMPDIFHFDFLGYHGTFIINNQGKAKIISGDFVDVDLSGILEENLTTVTIPRPTPMASSQIRIRTNDGFTYIFGGEVAALEYSLLLKDAHQELNQKPPIVNAWYLSRIIAPSGRTMKFHYADCNNWQAEGNSLLVFNQYYDLFAIDHDSEGNLIPNAHIRYNYMKECILDSIVISDEHRLTLTFHKSLALKMYNNCNAYSLCHENYKLDSIIISTSDREICKANLNYTYKSKYIGTYSSINWRFLASVFITGIGTYTLGYNHLSTYPDLLISTDADYLNCIDSYGFWKTTSLQGQIQDVVFPTGGRMHFTFEQHQYCTERHFHMINSAYDVEWTTLSTNVENLGGTRISNIETFIGDSLIEKKSYIYNKKGTYTSSGIYYNRHLIYPLNENAYPYKIINPSFYSLLDTHIGYSYVEEMIQSGTDISQTHKNAYTYYTGSDYYTSYGNPSINRYPILNADNLYYALGGALAYNERLNTKGKLLKLDYYKGNNVIVKTKLWKYNGIPADPMNLFPAGIDDVGCIDTIVIYSNLFNQPIARKMYLYPDVTSQEVSHDYSSDGHSYMTNNMYKHDTKLRIKETVISDSRNLSHFTRYTYPDEIVGMDNLSPYGLLVQLHRINNPIEEVSGYKVDLFDFVTSGTINLYAIGVYAIVRDDHSRSNSFRGIPDSLTHHFVDSIVPVNPDSFELGEMVYYPYLYQTKNLTLANPVFDYVSLSANNSSITYDSRYRLTCEYMFDFRNRPLYVKPFGKTHTTYTWNSTNDFYPSAKTIGNQTWNYTYIPYVGVSSVTDPRGITTYYSYDYAGRLIEEYQMVNGNKHILHAFLYHTKTE